MTSRFKAVRGHLYSVHWESDKEHGNYHTVTRIVAPDAATAIVATRPDETQKAHCVSCDMLAANLTIALCKEVLDEVYPQQRPFSDEEYRKLLGTSGFEGFVGYRKH